jgi:hypothetical protein
MSEAEVTRDQHRIKEWAEARGGRPSVVSDTARNARPGAILRFDFGKKDPSLDEVSWDEFFRIFDDNQLAVLLQEKTKSGNTSRFCKFVDASEHGLDVKPAKGAGRSASKARSEGPAAKVNGKASAKPAAAKASNGKATATKASAAKTGAKAKAAAPVKETAKTTAKTKASEAPAPATKAKTARSPAAASKAKAGAPAEKRSKAPAKAPAPAKSQATPSRSKASSSARSAGGDPAEATVTRDHDAIRSWVEARRGRPSVVEGTEDGGSGGLLRIDFGKPDPNLREVSWSDFFKIFDKSGVGFLHQDKTKSGALSRFNKFVDPEPGTETSTAPKSTGAAKPKAAATSARSAGTKKASAASAPTKTRTAAKPATKTAGKTTSEKKTGPEAAKAASTAKAKGTKKTEAAAPAAKSTASKGTSRKPSTAKAKTASAGSAKAETPKTAPRKAGPSASSKTSKAPASAPTDTGKTKGRRKTKA